MAKIKSLVLAMVMVLGVVMAPVTAEAAVRRVYYHPAPRRIIVVHRVPRPVYRHRHNNRVGAFLAGAVIGAILAR